MLTMEDRYLHTLMEEKQLATDLKIILKQSLLKNLTKTFLN